LAALSGTILPLDELRLDKDGGRNISQGKKETQARRRRKMSARTVIPLAMVPALLMTTAAFAQTGGAGGSPGATAPGNPSVPATGGVAPNTTGSGTTSPNPTVPNANINPGTGQKYDPSNLHDMNNPNNPATRR
jgi:hypothetical protein